MSTPETSPKRRSLAEIEALLTAEPAALQESCENLQMDIDNDYNILENLQEFPAKNRNILRAAMLKNIRTTLAQMKAQHCDLS